MAALGGVIYVDSPPVLQKQQFLICLSVTHTRAVTNISGLQSRQGLGNDSR